MLLINIDDVSPMHNEILSRKDGNAVTNKPTYKLHTELLITHNYIVHCTITNVPCLYIANIQFIPQ